MAKINSISTVPVNEWAQITPDLCAARSRMMLDDVLEQDNRLYVLAEKVRGELKSAQPAGEPESTALSLAELLCDLMSDRSTQYRLQDCLAALYGKLYNGVEKIAA